MSRVASRGSQVECRTSRVACRGSRVRKSRSRIKLKGQNLSACMFLIILKNEVFLSVLVG